MFRNFKLFLLGQLQKKQEGEKEGTETARTDTFYAFHVLPNSYTT